MYNLFQIMIVVLDVIYHMWENFGVGKIGELLFASILLANYFNYAKTEVLIF